jgi:hypothetical protein
MQLYVVLYTDVLYGNGIDLLGNVHFVERDLKVSFAFPAFSQTVNFIHVVKERNLLVTIGEESEEALVPTLKIWDLNKIERDGEPELLSVIKLSKTFPVRYFPLLFPSLRRLKVSLCRPRRWHAPRICP